MKKTIAWLRQHRVAVLKGGWSRERSISLKTGAAVEASFKRLKIKAISIDVKRNIKEQLKRSKTQFAFIALHGTFGEDGGVQRVLESLQIPYTGSGSLASAVAMDKNISKRMFINRNVPTAPWRMIRKGESLKPIIDWLKKGSIFIKPFDQGSAIGAARVDKPNQLSKALKACFRVSKIAMAERFIPGRELTVGILGKKALPVIEIIPEHAFYDFHSKYAAGGSRHLVPAPLSRKQTLQAQRISLQAFQALSCSAYGRVDIMLDHSGKMFVLEVNTIPGMTNTSLLPDAAKSAGLSFEALVLKISELSLRERGVFS